MFRELQTFAFLFVLRSKPCLPMIFYRPLLQAVLSPYEWCASNIDGACMYGNRKEHSLIYVGIGQIPLSTHRSRSLAFSRPRRSPGISMTVVTAATATTGTPPLPPILDLISWTQSDGNIVIGQAVRQAGCGPVRCRWLHAARVGRGQRCFAVRSGSSHIGGGARDGRDLGWNDRFDAGFGFRANLCQASGRTGVMATNN